MPFDDAKAIFPKECKVLAHGGVACRTGVEIRGDDSAHGEAAIETTGESGQGIRGCRGEEHGLGRFRGFVYQGYVVEGCRADEPTGSLAEDDLNPVA